MNAIRPVALSKYDGFIDIGDYTVPVESIVLIEDMDLGDEHGHVYRVHTPTFIFNVRTDKDRLMDIIAKARRRRALDLSRYQR